jgi:hypothetical protein
MTLDFEMVRELLLDVEAAPGPYEVESLNDAASRALFHAINLLTQGGYLDSTDVSTTRTTRNQMVLTLRGQDFLNAIRSDETWALLKVRLPIESSQVPLHIVEQYAYQLAMQKATGIAMSP